MLIDWFTVGAQAINFLILVWLLQRFLYKPILNAIDAREAKIAAELGEAAAKKNAAQQERDEFRAKSTALEQQKSELLRKAADDVGIERQRLLDTARNDSEKLAAKLNEAVTNQRDNLNREIVLRTQEEVFALARKALADLADAPLEDCMIKVFAARLASMSPQDKALLGSSSQKSGSVVAVRSAFELSAASRAALEAAVHESLPSGSKLNFETVPNLVCGIDLTADGRRLAWSVADYLQDLSKTVTTMLEPTRPAAVNPRTLTQHAA